MSIFNGSTLYISARSPFARRVRIALLEHQIDYSEQVLNVFESNPILEKHNPLRRVPVLVLRTGEEIVDSSYILAAIYNEKRNSPLLPFDSAQRLKALNWSGIATGLCEKIVEYYLETIRPSSKIDETLIKESQEIITDTLMRFENHMQNRKYVLGEQFTQTDIDWVCALDYVKLRAPALLGKNFIKISHYLENLGQRPAIKKTVPPPP